MYLSAAHQKNKLFVQFINVFICIFIFQGGLLQSPHTDENDVQTISHKCSVLPLKEFVKQSSPAKRQKRPSGSQPSITADTFYLAGSYDPTLMSVNFQSGVLKQWPLVWSQVVSYWREQCPNDIPQTSQCPQPRDRNNHREINPRLQQIHSAWQVRIRPNLDVGQYSDWNYEAVTPREKFSRSRLICFSCDNQFCTEMVRIHPNKSLFWSNYVWSFNMVSCIMP